MTDLRLIAENVVEGDIKKVEELTKEAVADGLDVTMILNDGLILGLEEIGEQPSGSPFAGYFNMDLQDLDVEIGFPVSGKLTGRGNIQPSLIPPCRTATCIYTGPYSDIEPAYNALFQWISENGYETTGTVYEFYLNDPDETPPEELRTEILFQLKG